MRRRTPARRPAFAAVVATAAAAAAVAGALALAILLPGGGERAGDVPAVGPATQHAAAQSFGVLGAFDRPPGCTANTVARRRTPGEVRRMLGILGRPARATDGLSNIESLPLAAVDPDLAARRAGLPRAVGSVYVVPSAAVRPRPRCYGVRPQRQAGAGACLALADGNIAMTGRCFTVREIRTGAAVALTDTGR